MALHRRSNPTPPAAPSEGMLEEVVKKELAREEVEEVLVVVKGEVSNQLLVKVLEEVLEVVVVVVALEEVMKKTMVVKEEVLVGLVEEVALRVKESRWWSRGRRWRSACVIVLSW